ncbi:MAG: FHA domain-containing protein [Planctomycetes bacterium]|nr:FHA domain-containing protein [Planctomycetota bacterium]
MMELHVCNKSGQLLKAYALGDFQEIIIGRDETCDVCIKSQSVSREHCCIERDGHDLVLRDLGSTGGTFLDGEKINQIRLRTGMSIHVGPAVLKFQDDEM